MGTIQQSPFFGLSYFIDKNKCKQRIGFVISKKISKKAVVRNKIRRQISETLYKEFKNLPIGFTGVFLIRQNILDASSVDINNMVLKVIENVKKNCT